MRGLLSDEYGISPAGIHWRTGAPDTGVRHERLSLDLPECMVVEPIRDGETLQDLLLRGDLDALLAPNPPSVFLSGNPEIIRIVKDFGSAERAYHKKQVFFQSCTSSLCASHWLMRTQSSRSRY